MKRKWAALVLCLATVAGLSACGQTGAAPSASPSEIAAGAEKIKVSVTFNALREFTQAVGGEKVEVSTIIPDGTEPHDFEPKAQDLVALSTAQVFVYNGLGMESWAEDAVAAAGNKELIAVDASEGAEPIQNTGEEEIGEHGQYDPHLWLSLKGAEIEAGNIARALTQSDPSNGEYYKTNCNAFISQLEALYKQYGEKFQSAKSVNFVTGHAAFGYLCRDFGLNQNSVEDVFAEGEPSAQQLAELVDYCRENHVTTIFAEEMASPDVSKTLAGEVGAKVETIYTMESAEDGKSYLERMESNLAKICESLQG